MVSFKLRSSQVVGNLNRLPSRVERQAFEALESACKEILAESLQQVPEKTKTLAKSGYYEVRPDLTATIGYGGNGNPINPRTGQHVSEYMLIVHEDLSARHDKGNAKFLENPVRQYQQKFLLGAAKYLEVVLR